MQARVLHTKEARLDVALYLEAWLENRFLRVF